MQHFRGMKPQIWGKNNKGANMIQKPISQFKKKMTTLQSRLGVWSQETPVVTLSRRGDKARPRHASVRERRKGSFVVWILQSRMSKGLPGTIFDGLLFY